MKTKIFAAAIAAAATLVMANSAFACSPGYKPVKIQGNWVCQLDASSSNTLTSQPQPSAPKRTNGSREIRSDIGQKLQLQGNHRNN